MKIVNNATIKNCFSCAMKGCQTQYCPTWNMGRGKVKEYFYDKIHPDCPLQDCEVILQTLLNNKYPGIMLSKYVDVDPEDIEKIIIVKNNY